MPYRQPAWKRRGRRPGGLYDVARLTRRSYARRSSPKEVPADFHDRDRSAGGGRVTQLSRSRRARLQTFPAGATSGYSRCSATIWSSSPSSTASVPAMSLCAARKTGRSCRVAFRRAGPRAARDRTPTLAYAEGYAIAERARSLQIIVEEGNQTARSFYQRSGFVPVEPELFELILPMTD